MRLVPDGLWELAAPLVPQFAPRGHGGDRGSGSIHRGGVRVDQRLLMAASAAVVWGVAGDCAPPVHRLDRRGEIYWSSAILDAASVGERGSLTGPNPVDRAPKPGSKGHVLRRVRTPAGTGSRDPRGQHPPTARPCNRWWPAFRRSAPAVDPAADCPASCAPTRATTPTTTDAGCAPAASPTHRPPRHQYCAGRLLAAARIVSATFRVGP